MSSVVNSGATRTMRLYTLECAINALDYVENVRVQDAVRTAHLYIHDEATAPEVSEAIEYVRGLCLYDKANIYMQRIVDIGLDDYPFLWARWAAANAEYYAVEVIWGGLMAAQSANWRLDWLAFAEWSLRAARAWKAIEVTEAIPDAKIAAEKYMPEAEGARNSRSVVVVAEMVASLKEAVAQATSRAVSNYGAFVQVIGRNVEC